MANEVTTGQSLNSYQGNANLAVGDAYGYAKIDLSPLQTFALKKYQNNLIDYQQQQEDRALLQKQFSDPAIYQNVDKTLADQLSPSMLRLKELAKKNLYKNPDSKEWYEFQDLYRENLDKNAQAKAVQKIKDDTKEALGKTADPHEKESLTAYINQLESYKLGEDIPVYNKYFAPVDKHLPNLVTSEMTKEIGTPDGKIRTVKTTVLNPLGGAALAQRKLVESPESFQTYKDIAHTTLESGDFDFINEKAAQAYNNGMLLNNNELRNKNQGEYEKFNKENPTATFRDFMVASGRENELAAIEKGHEYLKGERGALYEVPAESGKELAGYTYYTKSDGKKVRLNKPDYEVAAIYKATEKPAGAKEEILSEKLSITPKDQLEADTKLKQERMQQQGANYREQLQNTRAMFPYLYGTKSGIGTPDEEDVLNANSVLSEVSGIMNAGKQDLVDKLLLNGKKSVSDPTLLKEFSSLAKDGKTTIPPQKVEYDENSDEFIITYGKDGKKDAAPPQRINSQTYLTMKVKQKFPNKDIGTINAMISKIFNEEGSLKAISKKYGVENKTTPTPASGKTADIPTLKTKAEFDALPKGSFYYRDGKKYQK